MPTNKHAILRYRTIDRCLRNVDAQWTWRELSEACQQEILRSTGREISISERTIKSDISTMRSDEVLGYFAPIEYDRKEKSYYYSNPRYALTESPINKSDKDLLQEVISLLTQFTGLNEVTGIHDIITKLESSLDRRSSDVRIIQFDQISESPGKIWLYELFKSIKNHKALNISYQPFQKKRSNRIISPYLLKEYKGRWYLLALDHRVKALRVFALDRMKEVKESLATYQQSEVDLHHYFDNVIGVSVLENKEPEKIQIEVYGSQIQYLKTKPIHSSQRLISEGNDSAIFEVNLIVNYEFISELLSYQETIKILSPDSLIEQYISILHRMSEHYNS